MPSGRRKIKDFKPETIKDAIDQPPLDGPQEIRPAVDEVIDRILSTEPPTEAPTEAPAQESRSSSRPSSLELLVAKRWPGEQISLTAENDGPKARFKRIPDRPFVLVHFDEKPSAEIIAEMKDKGWEWKQRDNRFDVEKVWLKYLGDDRWSGHHEAQMQFREVANKLREGNGLPPVGQSVV